MLSGEGQQDMERIRSLIVDLREAEKVQLLERSNRTTAIAQSTIRVAEFGSMLAVGIVLIIGNGLSRRTRGTSSHGASPPGKPREET